MKKSSVGQSTSGGVRSLAAGTIVMALVWLLLVAGRLNTRTSDPRVPEYMLYSRSLVRRHGTLPAWFVRRDWRRGWTAVT